MYYKKYLKIINKNYDFVYKKYNIKVIYAKINNNKK